MGSTLPGGIGLPRVITKEKEEIQKAEVKRRLWQWGWSQACGPGRIATGWGARKRYGGGQSTNEGVGRKGGRDGRVEQFWGMRLEAWRWLDLGYSGELVQAPKGRGTSEQLCLHTAFVGFPDSSVDKESACNAGDTRDAGLILGLGSLEEGMATYSSIHAWRISWTEKPGRL